MFIQIILNLIELLNITNLKSLKNIFNLCYKYTHIYKSFDLSLRQHPLYVNII